MDYQVKPLKPVNMKNLQNSFAIVLSVLTLIVEYTIKVVCMVASVPFWYWLKWKDNNYVRFVDQWEYHPISNWVYAHFEY